MTESSSSEVRPDIQAIIQELQNDFAAEVKTKQDTLDVTQAHLRAATRELSEQRKQIFVVQAQCAELDLVNQRIRNLEKALEGEDQFDWTGRTELDGSDAGSVAGLAFRLRGLSSTMAGIGGGVDLSFSLDSEPAVPMTDSMQNLIRLRRLSMWLTRIEKLVEQRLSKLQGASAEKEFLCKKIVALCTNVPLDKVEDVSLVLSAYNHRSPLPPCSAVGEPRHRSGKRIAGNRYWKGVWLHAEGLSLRFQYDILLTDCSVQVRNGIM